MNSPRSKRPDPTFEQLERRSIFDQHRKVAKSLLNEQFRDLANRAGLMWDYENANVIDAIVNNVFDAIEVAIKGIA